MPGVLTPSWHHPTSAKAPPSMPILCQVAHPMPGCPRADDRPTSLPPNFCQKPPQRVPTPRQAAQGAMLALPNMCQSHLEVPTLTPGCSQRSPPPARAPLEVPTPRRGTLTGAHPTPGCSRRSSPHPRVLLEVPNPRQGALRCPQPPPRCTRRGPYPYQKRPWWCPPHPRVPLRWPTPRVPPPMPFPHPSCPWDRRSRRRRRDRGRWPR